MEIHRWHYYIVVNCALLHCLLAKPFSLNEAIAAETQQKQASETSPTKLEDSAAEHFSLNRALTQRTLTNNNIKLADNIIPRGKKISSLKYKKTFQIKSPLKPKKIKFSQKPRHKRKNQSVKREIIGNEDLNQKYIPLLKSLSMLVDNLLNSDTSDSIEANSKKYKRYQYYSEKRNEVCTCTSQSNNAESTSHETAITSATIVTPKVSTTEDLSNTTTQATTSAANNTTVSDVSSLRQNKNVPVLLPRNTFSSRGDNNGFSKRSSTTHNWSIEGNITRDHGNSEHNTGCGENESVTESNEENSCGTPRDNASGARHRAGRGNGDNVRNYTNTTASDESDSISEGKNKTATVGDFRGKFNKPKRQDKLETGRDETKSTKFLPQFIQRLRGYDLPESKVAFNAKPIQFKQNNEESNFNVTNDNTSHQRISDGGSTVAKENQNIHSRYEGVTAIETLNTTDPKNPLTKTPMVMIIDGYSVTRHKNGQNKLSKKGIHIHSK